METQGSDTELCVMNSRSGPSPLLDWLNELNKHAYSLVECFAGKVPRQANLAKPAKKGD